MPFRIAVSAGRQRADLIPLVQPKIRAEPRPACTRVRVSSERLLLLCAALRLLDSDVSHVRCRARQLTLHNPFSYT